MTTGQDREEREGRRGERGGATVMAVACAGVLLTLGAALGVVAAIVVAHRGAQSAADLAALAGAGAVGSGTDPCTRAAEVASANDAVLATCALADREVTVEVVVEGPHWLGQEADLVGRARAGPVGIDSG